MTKIERDVQWAIRKIGNEEKKKGSHYDWVSSSPQMDMNINRINWKTAWSSKIMLKQKLGETWEKEKSKTTYGMEMVKRWKIKQMHTNLEEIMKWIARVTKKRVQTKETHVTQKKKTIIETKSVTNYKINMCKIGIRNI